jgi:ADP-ribose pyrophosphatase
MRRSVHRGRNIELFVESAELPNGRTASFDVVRHPGAACILALDDDGRLVLIRQWRHCAGGWLWEAPAGTLAPGERAEECARREIVEETGLEATTMEPVGSILTAPGFTDERIHLFLARGLRSAPRNLDDDEVIPEIRHVSLAECREMVERGEIVDAKTIAGLFHLEKRVAGS